jgi:hypothetical protein
LEIDQLEFEPFYLLRGRALGSTQHSAQVNGVVILVIIYEDDILTFFLYDILQFFNNTVEAM